MGEYIVKSGDGWYKIAKNTGINVNDLLKLNNANLNTAIHPG
jgi:LysM repeat protein